MLSQAVDLLIVGAGPAGLSAAVNAASEGLNTLVVDEAAVVGGQAQYSNRIENYPGYVGGISGKKLVRRMASQARRFGARIKLGVTVTELVPEGELFVVHLSDDSTVIAHVLLVCCGLSWRKLTVPGANRLLGKGVYYGVLPEEAVEYAGRSVAVVGGANSALQAALNFADHGALVTVIVRGPTLEGSSYLIERVAESDIVVRYNTEIAEFVGKRKLDRALLTDDSSLSVGAVFIFIGAEPHTQWIAEHCACDDHGYLLVDAQNMTSKPGIFAAGDVVSGSTKRVATASGDGADCVQHIHAYLGVHQLV